MARVLCSDDMRPGVVSLPHGYGLEEGQESGEVRQTGPAINMLTDAEYCDELARTSLHKCVPVRVTSITSPETDTVPNEEVITA